MDKIKEYDKKIEDLRLEYINAAPSKRPIIALQGRSLKIAREIYLEKNPQQKMI